MKNIEYIELGGVKQCISIRSSGEGLPLLLYLHGGPGDAALPLVAKYNKALEGLFTVVAWEQRGAGKSYYDFGGRKIGIDDFVSDAAALTALLLERFGQEKLYLVGHSWGSVLGLRLIQRHPERFHAYVGCGQVVQMIKSSRHAWEYAVEKNRETGNKKALARLEGIDCTYTAENWLNDLLFVTGQVVRHKGSLYGKRSYNRMILDFLFSPDYSIRDLVNRQKGSLQAIQFLWQELMGVDFEGITEFAVPVAFVEGRHDHHVSSALARQYYESIRSPKAYYDFERSCHFPQWSEAERFAEVMAEVAGRFS